MKACIIPIDNNIEITSINTKYSPYQLTRIGEVGKFLLSNVFSNNVLNTKNQWVVSDLEDADNIQIIKKEMKNGIDDMVNGRLLNVDAFSALAVDDLFAFIDDFDRLFDYFIKNNNVVQQNTSFKSEIESTDEFVSEEDKLDLEDKFDRDGNEDSSYSLASKGLKSLFRLVFKHEYKDGKSQLFLNKEGLPIASNYSAVWTLLLTKLSGISNETDFKNALNSDDLLRQIPEIASIKQLLNIDNITGIKQVNQFTDFYNRFKKPTVSLKTSKFITSVGENGMELKSFKVVDSIKSNISTIEDIFTNNFLEGNFSIGMKQFVTKTATGINILQALPNLTSNIDDRLDFLSLLGIKFSNISVLSNDEAIQFDNDVMALSQRLYTTLEKRMQTGQIISNPIKQLKQRWGNISSETSSLYRLVQIESKYSSIAPTLSNRNPNGDLQYSVTLDSHLTTLTSQLNSAQSLEELYKLSGFTNAKYDPQFEKSHIINYLFDKSNNWKKFPNRALELNNLTGTVKEGKGKSTKRLFDREKILNDYSSMLQEKMTDVMRTETSASYFMLRLWDGIKVGDYVDENGFQNNFVSNFRFNNQLLEYLKGEIERINSYDTKLKENPTLPETFKVFSIFSEILTNEQLKEDLLKEKNLTLDSNLFSYVLGQVNDYFENKGLAEFKDLLSENSITSDDLMEYFPNSLKWNNLKGDSLHRAFIAANFIQNVEYSILYSGDPLFFNKKGLIDGAAEFHKRNKGVSSTGENAANLSEITEFLKTDVILKNYSMAAQLGVTYRDNSKTTLTRTLKEIKPITQEDSSYDFEKYPKAKDAKIADGQGYINLDNWRELSLRHGVNSQESEDVYKHEMFVFKRDILNKQLTNEEEKEFNELAEKIGNNISKYSIPIEKLMVFGNHIGTENTKTGKQTPTTINAKMYDKFSVAVLFPSMVKDKPILKKLLLDMVKGNYGYVKYESGSKLFSTSPIETSKLNQGDADVVSTELIKMQIKVHSEQKTATAIPTQLLKLIFSNLFTQGNAASENIKNIYNSYLTTLGNIQKIQTKELFEDLGIKEDGNVDFSKLSSKLTSEANRRGLNSNFLEALEVDPLTNKLKNRLETNYNPSLAIDMIAGIADNYLRRYKISGGDFVLLTNANQSKLQNYIQNENGTIACECRISLNKQHVKLLNKIHPDGKPIKTLDRLNELVKGETEESKEWIKDNEKALLIILDRVPTQGANSMEFAKVVEFYPSIMGNVVTLPDEIVIKSGLDFDYDKQKTLLPSLTSNGDYINSNAEEIEKQIQDVKKERKGIATELYNVETSFPEITKKVNQFRNDINTGEFFNYKSKFQDEASIDKLKSYFTDLINVDIAKQGLLQQLNSIEQYNNFNVDVEDSFQILNMELHQKMKDEYKDLYNKIELIQNTFKSLTEGIINTELQKVVEDFDNFRNRIINLVEMKNQEFNGQANDIIQQYINTLSAPEKYEDLIVPNNTETLKPIADNIANLTEQKVELPKLGQVFMYSNNLKVRNYYTNGKNMLSPFASANPTQQLMTYSNVDINANYKTFFNKKDSPNKKDIPNKINNLLLTKEELAKVFNKENDKWLMSSNLDALGRSKQIINGEGISATVDVAADPWVAFLRLNYKNVGVVNFMNIVQGIPFERIMSFINNPGVQYYTNALMNGSTKKEALTDLIRNRFQKTISTRENSFFIENKAKEDELSNKLEELKNNPDNDISKLRQVVDKDSYGRTLGTLYYYNTSSTIDLIEKPHQYTDFYKAIAAIDKNEKIQEGSTFEVFNNILDTAIITPENLDKYIKADEDRLLFKQKTLEAKGTPQYADLLKENNKRLSDELRIFAHFYQLSNSAFALKDLFSYFDFDKTKAATPTDINNKQKQKDKLLLSGLISKESFETLDTNSIVSKFNNTSPINEIYKSLFTILQDGKVQSEFNKIYSEQDSFLNPDRNVKSLRNLPKALNNDFLYSVIYNLAKLDGVKFGDRAKELLIKSSDKLTLAERLGELKKESYYSDIVSQFPVLNRFIGSRFMNIGINSEVKQTEVIHNIQFIKDSIQDISEIESIKEQLQELYKNGVSPFIELHDTENEIKQKQQDAIKINETLKPLIKDLFAVGFAQNGFSNSYFSYQEFIPYVAYKDMFNEAYDKFNTLSSIQKQSYMNRFNSKFAENNPMYSNTDNLASGNIKTYDIVKFKKEETSSKTENKTDIPTAQKTDIKQQEKYNSIFDLKKEFGDLNFKILSNQELIDLNEKLKNSKNDFTLIGEKVFNGNWLRSEIKDFEMYLSPYVTSNGDTNKTIYTEYIPTIKFTYNQEGEEYKSTYSLANQQYRFDKSFYETYDKILKEFYVTVPNNIEDLGLNTNTTQEEFKCKI